MHHGHTTFVFTWCVQKSLPYLKWQNSFRMCRDKFLWLLFFVEVFTLLAGGYYLQKNEQDKIFSHRLMIIGAACLFCLTTAYRPKSIPVRIFFISVVLAGMVYWIVLITILALVVLHPILTTQVQTIEKLIDNDFKLMGDQFTYMKIANQREVMSYACLVIE